MPLLGWSFELHEASKSDPVTTSCFKSVVPDAKATWTNAPWSHSSWDRAFLKTWVASPSMSTLWFLPMSIFRMFTVLTWWHAIEDDSGVLRVLINEDTSGINVEVSPYQHQKIPWNRLMLFFSLQVLPFWHSFCHLLILLCCHSGPPRCHFPTSFTFSFGIALSLFSRAFSITTTGSTPPGWRPLRTYRRSLTLAIFVRRAIGAVRLLAGCCPTGIAVALAIFMGTVLKPTLSSMFASALRFPAAASLLNLCWRASTSFLVLQGFHRRSTLRLSWGFSASKCKFNFCE